MHLFTRFSICVLVAILFFSCETDKKSVEELQADVIEVHDEVMPKMDDIMKLKAQLKLIKADTAEVLPSDELILVNNLIDNLEKADKSMMNWMRNYDSLMEGMSEEEKLTYLMKEEAAIKLVKQKMLSAISEAKIFLEKQQD
ncbi:hypothetical protein GCM10027429_12640 [Marivirga atlantica]|jgi:hypothetical protein|uniref:Viral A-type inclusion protein n=1 Tax=Marivirga atlantica TaxID=1548457 RepID=A0A937ALG7_9BACT|nr:hypothetical protein [Marivirga atlantica]MBL0764877.1 hypothetical protein [Marivirga atlantica]